MAIELKEFSFYPSEDEPTWGCLHVLTDAYGGVVDRHATLRGDPDLVRMIKEALHDRGPRPELPGVTIGGVWQMAVGWPDDWDFNAFESDESWSPRFEATPEGTRLLNEGEG